MKNTIENPKITIRILLILLISLSTLTNNLYAQGPNAPEAASFEPVDATDMVNLVTGDLSYVLPLLNIPSPEGGYPIALSYHAGIAMDQEASWVGLGWSLNPGAINRGVNGYPDDWGKTNVNEFFYDKGWDEDYYSFGAGVTLSGGISVGIGASWGSNQSVGGFVSASISLGGNAGIGGSIGINGSGNITAGIYGSLANGLSANLSTSGVGIGYNSSGLTSYGFNLNYNYSSGLSGGVSASQNLTNKRGRGSGVGINFSSSGVSAYGKVNGLGAGVTTYSSNISSGDYDISTSMTGLYLPVYIFYVNYSHTQVNYSLYKYNNLYTSGMLYPVAANELQPDDDGSGLSRLMNENHFMDVNLVQRFGTGDKYDDLIEDYNKNDRNNLVLPNYDNYNVNAQGLSGTISPYALSELNLSARGRGDQNADNEYIQYLNHDISEYMTFSQSEAYHSAVEKKYFTFTSAYNSFFRLKRSVINKTGMLGANSDFLMDVYKTGVEVPYLEVQNRKREGNSIETYTNKEIRENVAGFIEAKQGDGLLNRQDDTVFLDDGIGAYQITTLDGKTYHYSLPVYQFESFYKNFKNTNGNGDAIVSEDENFFEIQKITPYATHWLLTAITGPDYIDFNINGKVDEQDYGYWVEFDYGKWSDGYTWQTPNGRFEEIENKNKANDKTYAYSWGRKQIYYLDAVKTRTHTALFVKDVREDNKSIEKIKYQNKWSENLTFNPSYNGKKITQQKSYSIPADVEYFSYTGEEIIMEKTCLNAPYFYTGRKSTVSYIDIPINYSLKLSKIILLKNTPSIYNKESGNITNQLKGYYYSDNIYSNVFQNNYANDYIGECNTGLIQDLYFGASNIKKFEMQLHQNVLDIKDIEGLDLESKASQVIEFEHSYSLADNAPNTDSGRLTLEKVNFKGKKGTQLIPPYEFKYLNSTTSYDQDDIDPWGYNKTNPQVWSLNEITTPTGGKIKMIYEQDNAISAVNHTIEFAPGNTTHKMSLNLDGGNMNNGDQPKSFYIKSEENLGIQIGDKLDISYLYTGTKTIPIQSGPDERFDLSTRYEGLGTVIGVDSDNKYELVYDANNWQYDYDPYSNSSNPTNWNCDYYTVKYSASIKLVNPVQGGGIRTKSIAVSDGIKNIATTEYIYENGITSYIPSKEQRGVPYVSELPSPMVMYGNVKMVTKDGNNNELGSTAYEFETIESRKEETGYIFSLGEAFRVKENQNQTFENGRIITNKFTIENKLGNLGRIKSITSYNNKNQILNKKENTYKQNLDTDGEIGVVQESHISYKRVKKDDLEKFYVSSTSKVNYPSVLESVKHSQSGFSIEKHFDKYDLLTGQLLETRTYASDGTAFKTETVPAYTKYPEMGSKVDNPNNKNMLTQQAANYTYLLDESNNTEKVIGANITTWSNDWVYRNYAGVESSPTNNVEKIWRKHQSYFWKGAIDDNGTYVGFNSNNDDGFVWGVGLSQTNSKWIQASEVTLYDHFSTPLETMDINSNFASSKMCDFDSKVLAVSNAKYTEMFYSGAEYIVKDENDNDTGYSDGEVKTAGQDPAKAHTGTYSVSATVDTKAFEVNLKSGDHRSGNYKISVWVNKGAETNARININGGTKTFNGEQGLVAGDWVLLNHYENLSTAPETVYVTSASGTVYFDDFRMHPATSSMNSYVYNEWDELWYVIGNNGLSSRYEYDDAGRLVKTYTEVIDNSSVTGGFKLVHENDYHYKYGTLIPEAPSVPSVPSGLTLSGATGTSFNFSWNAVSGATGYKIYKNGIYVSTTTSTSGTITGLASSTTYNVQVLAYNDVGDGALCSSVAMTTTVNYTYQGRIINNTGHTISSGTMQIIANGSQKCTVSMPSLANGATFNFSTTYSSPIFNNGTFTLSLYTPLVGISTANYFNMAGGSSSTNGYFSYQGWGYQATVTSTGPQYSLVLNIY